MKRYWVLIVISVLMIASVGTFYIQSVFATNNKPVFTIEKINGNEQEIDSAILTGLYFNELNYIGEEFEINVEGTKYLEDRSFFDRVKGSYGSPRIKQLQKDYRNFMRAKYSSVHSYFENEEFLAYADVSYKNPYTMSSEFQFAVAVLDKQTNKTHSFEHLVPNSSDFWYLDAVKVQVVDDHLKVLTVNDMREIEGQEMHLYTFDLEKETLLNDEVIFSFEHQVNEHINIEKLDMGDPTKESEYIAFIKTSMEPNEEGFMENVTDVELIVYDLTADTPKVINLESFTEYGYPEYIDRQNIYFTYMDENGILKITTYDIESEQIIGEFDVDLSNHTVGKNIVFNDEKLYLVDSYVNFESIAFITVIHLENGEKLFEGEITTKGQISKEDKVELHIYDIVFE